MTKALRYALIAVLVFSPVWVGSFATHNEPPDSVAGLGVLLGLIFGTPIILVVGIIVSILTRKSTRAGLLSVIGYLVPAIFVCGYLLLVTLS